MGVATTAVAAPPQANGFHSEGRRIVGYADDEHPAVGLHVVDPIGDRHAFGLRAKIMILHPDRVSAPHPSVVLRLARQFLFLGIHADGRIADSAELAPLVVEQVELPVAERTGIGRETLAVGVQGIIHFVQQTPDRVGTNLQPQLA